MILSSESVNDKEKKNTFCCTENLSLQGKLIKLGYKLVRDPSTYLIPQLWFWHRLEAREVTLREYPVKSDVSWWPRKTKATHRMRAQKKSQADRRRPLRGAGEE